MQSEQMESPPVIVVPRIITRKFIQQHPNWIFLYGNDYYNKGCLGQAWEAYGEPNTVAIPTCNKLCPSSSSKYWQDLMFDDVVLKLENAFKPLEDKNCPIIPFRKIGCGCSRMNTMAPMLFDYMQRQLSNVAYPNIKIDWNA